MTNLTRLVVSMLLGIALYGATAHAQRVAYYTDWPEVVPVLSPDPVLGDKRVWEYWVYTETFAKRFKGFAPEGANPELRGGIQAMVFRVYRKAFRRGQVPDYPEQYACDLDVYFDSSIVLELDADKPVANLPSWYPDGIAESYKNLQPVSEEDRRAFSESRKAKLSLKEPPLIFAAPLDGRFTVKGTSGYHRSLSPGLAMIGMVGGVTCRVLGPKEQGGGIWLSLLGKRPFKNTNDSSLLGGLYGGVIHGYREVFEPGSNPEKDGYFRIPDAFHEVVLPKATLAKSINECIWTKHARLVKSKGTSEWGMQQVLKICEGIEKRGVIYDFFYERPGWHKPGF
jgi:hypothetical protein